MSFSEIKIYAHINRIKHNKHTNIVNPLTTFVYCNNHLIFFINSHGGQVIYNKFITYKLVLLVEVNINVVIIVNVILLFS